MTALFSDVLVIFQEHSVLNVECSMFAKLYSTRNGVA